MSQQVSHRQLHLKAALNILWREGRFYWSNRSLLAWARLARHVWRRFRDRSVPHFITVAPTNRCQCRCVHCFSNSGEDPSCQELSTEEWKGVIDQAAALGALHIFFCGGEPLLRADIDELIAHAHKAGMITRLTTNGLALTQERAARLKKAGLTECGVSLDSPDPATHDRLRGVSGTYERAIQAIGNARRAGLGCRILVMATHDNIPSGLEELIALARRLKVDAVYLRFPVASGRWNESYNEVLSEEEKAQVRALQDLRFIHAEQATSRSMCCVCNNSVFHVTSSGDVIPCAYVPYALGNVRNLPLREIWRLHSSELRLECRGECPMNIPGMSQALQKHAESVSRRLGTPGNRL